MPLSPAVHCDPPGSTWPNQLPANARTAATGHQAYLWHPGILAKHLALDAFAQSQRLSPVNLIVDHDAYDPLGFDVPYVDGQAIKVRHLRLSPHRSETPPTLRPPIDPAIALQHLHEGTQDLPSTTRASLDPLLEALQQTHDDFPSLAHQFAHLLGALTRPWVQPFQTLYASELVTDAWRDRLLADAHRCARAFNRAVAQHPHAGIKPLHLGVDVVQLPLWSLHGPHRFPVYAHHGQLVAAHGEPTRLAPRATLLTAIMRSEHGWFIHGKGGGVYDRVTEAWYEAWTGERLNPMAVVSADLHLDFPAPLADRDELERAVWYAHHLPHNLDRVLRVASPDSQRKQELLDHMHDDRDRKRRRAAFEELHAINDRLAQQHAAPLAAARRRVDQLARAAANARLARRRDWPFFLYPDAALRRLAKHFKPTPLPAR